MTKKLQKLTYLFTIIGTEVNMSRLQLSRARFHMRQTGVIIKMNPPYTLGGLMGFIGGISSVAYFFVAWLPRRMGLTNNQPDVSWTSRSIFVGLLNLVLLWCEHAVVLVLLCWCMSCRFLNLDCTKQINMLLKSPHHLQVP